MAGKVVDITLKLIDKVTSPLGGVSAKLQNSGRQWETYGRVIQRQGKAISAVGSSMTKSLTVPIVGAGVASVKMASEFEAGMSKVQSISGATETQVGKLADKAKEMGAKTKFSASEATEAYSYMAMAGWKAGDMVNGIEGIMKLAGATGESLATTSDIVTDSLTAFGKTAKSTGNFVDVMAATANNANTNVSMLGESFKYVAPVAGAMNYSLEDTSLALGLMANAGVKASTAGTSLRSWMSRMASPTKATAQAMADLGISLTDSNGNMKDFSTVMSETRGAFSKLTESQQAQYAAALAGKQGMSGLLAITGASKKDFDKLSEAIQKSNGACSEMYDVANNNLNGQLTVLKSSVESLAISIGEQMTPYVKAAAKWLQGVADKFNALDDGTKKTIVKIGLIVAAIGPGLLIFGKLVTGVGGAIRAFGRFGKAIKAAGSIGKVLLSPCNTVVLALAAIVVATILVVKNWDKIKKVAGKVFGFAKKVAEDLGFSFDGVKQKLAPIGDKFHEIGGKLQTLWKVVHPTVSKIGDIFKTVFQGYVGAAIGAAVGAFQSLFNSVSSIVSGIMTMFGGLIDFLTGVFTGNWSQAWEGVKSIFSGAFQSLVSLAKAPINAVIGIINGAIAGINKIGITIPDWVPGVGGNSFKINIPTIPALAHGTGYWKGGLAQISERGGEIVDLPRGARVYPHDESVKRAYKDGMKVSGAGCSVKIPKLADQIIIREDADIKKMANALGEMLDKYTQNMGRASIGYNY